MSNIPENLKYTKTHEWIKISDDKVITVGITDHAQGMLGDMVYVELPEKGTMYSAGDDCAVVESVKAASDVYCPISGEVTDCNQAIVDTPELVNQEPFGDGWIFRVKLIDEGELDGLLDAFSRILADGRAAADFVGRRPVAARSKRSCGDPGRTRTCDLLIRKARVVDRNRRDRPDLQYR